MLKIPNYLKPADSSRLLAGCILCLLILSCSPAVPVIEETPPPSYEADTHSSFTMGNKEIRQDILNALTEQGIEYWINADGSVGFFAANIEAVDAIGFNAIGAYAARN